MKKTRRNNISVESLKGTLASLLVGIFLSFIIDTHINTKILMYSVFLIAGFFITTFFQFLRLNKEEHKEMQDIESFDWGMEINLKKFQIDSDKASSMMLFAGFIAGGSLVAISSLVRDFPQWSLAHQAFFPFFTLLFVTCLHFSLRWWFNIRLSAYYLKVKKR